MKIIHTSDWHIGQNFYRFERDDEHEYFFSQLASILAQEQPDALVVSGDVFHTAAPSSQSKRLFVRGVLSLRHSSPSTAIVITAGNHDSGSRLEAESDLWDVAGVHVIGTAHSDGAGRFDPSQFVIDLGDRGCILASPYFHAINYPSMTGETPRDERQREYFATLLGLVSQHRGPVVMMAHLAVDGCNWDGHEDLPIGGMLTDALADLGEGYDYLALGHIHKPQRITERVYYSGSPLPVSFSEDYPHYVNVVEIDRHGEAPQVRRVEIMPLRHVKTVPPKGADLEAALQALAALDDNDDSYIRVLVDQDTPLAADADDRANAIARDKACHFCEIRKKPRKNATETRPTDEIAELEDFTQYDPIDIAKRSYANIYGCEMDPDLMQMMEQAIGRVMSKQK